MFGSRTARLGYCEKFAWVVTVLGCTPALFTLCGDVVATPLAVQFAELLVYWVMRKCRLENCVYIDLSGARSHVRCGSRGFSHGHRKIGAVKQVQLCLLVD